MLKLVKPSKKYQKTFIEGVKEIQRIDEGKGMDLQRLDIKAVEKDFFAYLRKLKDNESGYNLPKGYVCNSDFWLIDNNKFVGKVGLRHKLTPKLRNVGGHIGYIIRPSCREKGYGSKILALALKKAKLLGIKKVLVTCAEKNIGSKKIIEKNGGKLFSRSKIESGIMELRYWVKT